MKPLIQLIARRECALLAILFYSFLGACTVTEPSPNHIDEYVLIGTWKIDLRPTPDSEPYYKELVVTSVEGKSFTGTFYDTTVTQARINTDWGKLRLAFVTSDGSGAYNHSAIMGDNKLEGLSNSTGRDFLSYWSAVKQHK